VEPDGDGDVDVGKEGDVEDDGGEDIGEDDGDEDIGEHDVVELDGVEPDVEAIGSEEGGGGGKGIGVTVHDEKECDDDGGNDDSGHVSEDSSFQQRIHKTELHYNLQHTP